MTRILNLGCGNDFYGTDRVDMFQTPATTKVTDLNKRFPYKNNLFDEVYCKSVIEHIKNLDLFIKEIYRVLKPGGKVYIRTDYAGYLPMYLFKSHEHNNILNPLYKADAYSHEKGEDAHFHLFVESHLRYLFKDFKNIKVNYVYGGRNKFIHLILKSLPFKLGCSTIDLFGEK